VRIDVMFGVAGVSPRRAWRSRVHALYGKVRINIMGKKDLMSAKSASGRPQDRLDLKRLEAVS